MDRRDADSPIGRVVPGGRGVVPVRVVDPAELAGRRAGVGGGGGVGIGAGGSGVHLVREDDDGGFAGDGGSSMRLVGGVGAGREAVGGVVRGGAVRRGVASENRLAAGLGADDARLLLALRASELIEGGRLAMLRPERRERLVAMATRVGLRPFDAHLVIAIAQEAARRGERVDRGDAAGRLRLVPMAGHGGASRGSVMSEDRGGLCDGGGDEGAGSSVVAAASARRVARRAGRGEGAGRLGSEWFRLLVSAGLAALLLIAAVRWLFG